MANTNSENPRIGREFQNLVQSVFEKRYCIPFEQEATIPIGKPPKKHKYDLASIDCSIVVECKCYTWTDAGNIPSAKRHSEKRIVRRVIGMNIRKALVT